MGEMGQDRKEGALGAAVRVLASPLAGGKERGKISLRLSAAGYGRALAPELFLSLKLLWTLAAALAAWAWMGPESGGGLLDRPLDALKILFVVFLAARLPDWWLSGKIKERRARIRQSIPQGVDLMTICVESGVSLEDTFDRVSRELEATAPEVAAEFRTTRSEMLVMDRFEALRRLERRSGLRELGTMASSLLQSMRYGTPLADSLRSIAADCRAAQVSELEEKAGAISARIGIPLVLLILFPLVALIAAPALINLMRSFGV
jgi:tight adherence protein C